MNDDEWVKIGDGRIWINPKLSRLEREKTIRDAEARIKKWSSLQHIKPTKPDEDLSPVFPDEQGKYLPNAIDKLKEKAGRSQPGTATGEKQYERDEGEKN